MALWLNFLWVILSAAVIIFTAEFAIKSSVAIAKKYGLSDAFIGMTVLSIGTSMPEIMTHIIGSISIVKDPLLLHDISGLVIGANIGSDMFQQNFVLGLVGILGVVVMNRKRLITDVGGLIAATSILLAFSLNSIISRLEGFVLVALYIAYLVALKKFDLLDEEDAVVEAGKNHVLKNSAIVIASFAAMAFAANSLLKNSEILVKATSISASFFGVILLGVASAFPELTTSLIAVLKKKARISAGILIGSNVTNPMLALGLGAWISSYTVPSVAIIFDLPVKIASAALILLIFRRGKMEKWQAAALIALYIAYIALRGIYFPTDVFAA